MDRALASGARGRKFESCRAHLDLPSRAPVVLLHGFAQDGLVWADVSESLSNDRAVFCPDLRGHGKQSRNQQIDSTELCADISALTEGFGPVTLAGYSMGARVALDWALSNSTLIEHLVLISPTAGIEDPKARHQRVSSDAMLAEILERDGIDRFIEVWEELPIWADDSDQLKEAARVVRRRQDPQGLAAALIGFGAGVWPERWSKLATLETRTTLIVGERDSNCVQSAQRMRSLLPNSQLEVISGAGHALVLEAPQELALLIDS